MSAERRSRGGFGAGFVLLVVLGVAAKFWVWFAVAAGVLVLGAVIGWAMWRVAGWVDARTDARAGLVARADEQHAQILAGDDRGLYGEYRPEIPTPGKR